MNRLAFSEDGRDDYLCAEHYVMLGNWDRDLDRYSRMQDVLSGFLRSLYGEEILSETIDARPCAPENARALVGTGTPDDFTAECSPARAPHKMGAPARRRASDGMRDSLIPRRAAARRVRAAHQPATIEECADLAARVRPRGAHDSGAR